MVKKAKKRLLTDNCISIETELSKLKLWANLIPLQSFKVNLRHILLRKEWNAIRSAIYKRDEYKCIICKRDDVKLNAHEDWVYDYKKGLQKLNRIISLCDLCHNNIHLGYSGSVDIESKEKIRQHWCKINNQNEEDFKRYLFNVFVLWHLKNKIQWKIVDSNGIEITRIAKLEDLLNSLDIVVDSTTEDLMQIHNMNPKVAKKLRECGITSTNQLIEHKNLAELADKSKIPLSTLNKYKLKAESLVKKEIYQIAPFTIPDERFIYLDIETDLKSEKIWLIGFEMNGKYTQFYADTWEQEEGILLKFVKILKTNPKVTLLSFSGTNFDIRVLKNAMERFGIDTKELTSHLHLHIDLCTLIKRSLIVPIKSYKLKDLGALFKYPFKHTHLDGRASARKFLTHIEKGTPLEQEILEYAEDDVKVLPFLIETIKKGEGIIKKKFSDLASLDSPIELIGDKNELTVKVRDFYEEHGSLSIRKDKRYNSFKTEIRFYGRKLKDLDFIRNAMVTLSFGESLPYQRPSSCYVPYYGKDQVIRFIKTIKPRKNNDISRLTTNV